MKYNCVAANVAVELALSSRRFRPRHVQPIFRTSHPLRSSRHLSSTYGWSIARTPQRGTGTVGTTPAISSAVQAPFDTPKETLSDSANNATNGERPPEDLSADGTPSGQPPTDPAKFFKTLMRTVPHPVAVITARQQDVEDDVMGTFAATVSSFNTVSLDPDLVISFNLKALSTTYKTIVESKYFTVTFPQMNWAGAVLVESFSRGNDPSPFRASLDGRPTPRTVPLTNEPPIALRHPPPAVALAEYQDAKESGFAFAFQCEYQTSTPVGDHIIVTGRVTPETTLMADPAWAVHHKKQPFQEAKITLGHVHGAYSSAHTGSSFANAPRLDEASDKIRLPHPEIRHKIDLCKRRLRSIAQGKRLQQGATIDQLADAGQVGLVEFFKKVAALNPEILDEYERYYMQRLVYWQLESRQVLQLHGYGDLEGHQRVFVNNKMLLSEEDLDQEIALYEMRLSKIRLEAQQDPATVDTIIEAQSVDELSPEERAPDPNLDAGEEVGSRNEQLEQYFRQRVHLLMLAKLQKAEGGEDRQPARGKQRPEQNPSPKSPPVALKRFLGVLKNDSLETIKSKYRRYQLQISSARLALIGLEEVSGGHPDVPILKNRIEFFTPRLDLLETAMKERIRSSAEKDSLAQSFKSPITRDPPNAASPVLGMGKMRSTSDKVSFSKVIRQMPSERYYRFASVERHESEPEVGDSTDQLDHTPQDRADVIHEGPGVTRAVDQISAGAEQEVRIGRAQVDVSDADPMAQHSEREYKAIQKKDEELTIQNPAEGKDYLLLDDSQGQEVDMPSPNDFIDVKRMRKERMAKEEEERRQKRDR